MNNSLPVSHLSPILLIGHLSQNITTSIPDPYYKIEMSRMKEILAKVEDDWKLHDRRLMFLPNWPLMHYLHMCAIYPPIDSTRQLWRFNVDSWKVGMKIKRMCNRWPIKLNHLDDMQIQGSSSKLIVWIMLTTLILYTTLLTELRSKIEVFHSFNWRFKQVLTKESIQKLKRSIFGQADQTGGRGESPPISLIASICENFRMYFHIIWFLDTQNGFYFIVKGMKMHKGTFCHCPFVHFSPSRHI